jgi:hypothetical protein
MTDLFFFYNKECTGGTHDLNFILHKATRISVILVQKKIYNIITYTKNNVHHQPG